MAAFFIWLEHGPDPINQRVAVEMLHRLKPYGGDHHDLQCSESLALGVCARWQTEEDVGEQQPLYDASKRTVFLFDGRIDNREHLIAEIGTTQTLSDAALLHAFLLQFGDSRLAEVVGPFAFVWFDLHRAELKAYRDTMGGRYLCFHQSNHRLILASTEEVFLGFPEVGHRIRKRKIVGWLTGLIETHDEACLQDVKLLRPGYRLQWQRQKPNSIDFHSFYRPDPKRRLRLNSDEAYAAEFRRLLDQAVNRRLRSRQKTKIGVMLSGGLDSAPIAVSAAKLSPRNLVAFSWIFDRDSEMDERPYSTPLCQQLGIEQKMVVCDDLWPHFDEDTHSNPLFPVALPYCEFQQQTFRQANQEGVAVLLSGLQGDLLYETSNRQVLELWNRGKWRQGFETLIKIKKHFNLTALQTSKRYLLAAHRWLAAWVNRRRAKMPITAPYLTESAQGELNRKAHWLTKESQYALRVSQYQIVLDGFAGEDAMLGRWMENKYNIERRYPFRDRDLCEFLLAIPTEQLEHLGEKRPIVKRAYAAEFGAKLLGRNDKTDFSGALLNGIERDPQWRQLLRETPQYWREFVKKRNFSGEKSNESMDLIVLWRCAYYNFWHRLWYDSTNNKDS